MAVDKAGHSTELPEYLKEALKTEEVGGYKLYEVVLDDVLARQQGLDRPVVRQAIDTYVQKGLIERCQGKEHVYLKDLTASYPPRLTESLYHCLQVVREHLSHDEFRRLPYAEIRPLIKTPSSIYHWVTIFVEFGFLENERKKSGMYRLGSQAQAVVYANGSYEEGRLINFNPTEPASENSISAINQSEALLAKMAKVVKRLESRLQVSKRIHELRATLEEAGTESAKIEELLAPLRIEYEPVEDWTTSEHELRILKTSLPVWELYLAQEKN